jgi:DNA-directed RNA polymerase subunit N (RpoN/RPB10)
MSGYIRCPECGFCIGTYSLFIEEAKKHINSQIDIKKISAQNAYNKPPIPTMEQLFNSLSIVNRCCRTHIFTQTKFDKMYN